MTTLQAEGLDRDFVPNIVRPCKVAFVGEAPGEQEVAIGEPFVGPSGNLLFNLAGMVGIYRHQCSILNVCQHRPPGNDITAFAWNSPMLTAGREALRSAINEANPNVVILLGNLPLHVALHGDTEPRRWRYPDSILDWRGSVFWSSFLGRKCVATVHPAFVLRQFEYSMYLLLDLRKAAAESKSPEYTEWKREFKICEPLDFYLSRIADIKTNKTTFAFDVEGGETLMLCIGFATSPQDAFTIPFVGPDGRRYWSPHDEAKLWKAIASILTDREILKIGQNISYDITVLLSNGILVAPPIADTMLLNRALMPEMRAGLATLASIYTHHHFYKEERDSEDWSEFMRYNATDCAVTFEVYQAQQAQLTDKGQRQYYNFTLDLVWPAIYMQKRGLQLDTIKRSAALETATREWYRLQYLLDQFKPVPQPAEEFFRRTCVVARCQDWSAPRKEFEFQIDEIERLAKSWDTLSWFDKTHLRVLTKTILNTSSTSKTGEIAELLYDKLKLPIPTKDGVKSKSTDVGTLLEMMHRAKVSDIGRFAIKLILEIRAVRKFIELLSSPCDDNFRWRFSFNLAGTETGRPTAHKAADGSGFNPLTTPKHGRLGSIFRPLIVPTNRDHYMFEVDLSGADGWTVAAHCARLGDTTMLDDYRAGIKPYAVIALMYMKKANQRTTREELKHLTKTVEIPGWLKFVAKRAQHGTSYGLGPKTGVIQLLKDSWKLTGEPIYVEEAVFAALQELFLTRYVGIRRWHEESMRLLKTTGKLRAANGSLRQFYGRRTDPSTWREWLAHEPQMNTAYATFLALHRLWYDTANRDERGFVIIKPSLMFYDALVGEFPISKLDFAVAKLREWFDNEIKIGGIPVKITYEGHYGPAWGDWIGSI